MKAKLTLIAISAGMLLSGAAIYSCARASASEKPLKSAALFDSFSYKGMDDFYESNPLPDQSSFYNPILPGWYSDLYAPTARAITIW